MFRLLRRYRDALEEDVVCHGDFGLSSGLTDTEPLELVRRTWLALDAYDRAFDVPAILAREYDHAEERCRRNGWRRALAKLPTERAWLEANRALF